MTKALFLGRERALVSHENGGLELYVYLLRHNLVDAPVPPPAAPGPGAAQASLSRSPVTLERGANVPSLLASGMARLMLHK